MSQLTHHPQSLEKLKARLPAALVPWSYSEMMEYYRRGVGLPDENIFDFEDGLRIQVSVGTWAGATQGTQIDNGIRMSFLQISASAEPGGNFMLWSNNE
jgi:hypothetical protein